MQPWPDVKFVIGDADILNKMPEIPAFPVFDDAVVNFLNTFSKMLLSNPLAKTYPDVATLAFWCRKASLNQMAREYAEEHDRIGRGVVFHIAPSNIALNFAYSMAASLLAGNACVVRLPSREFPQVDIVCEALQKVLAEDTNNLGDYLVLMRFGHEKAVTDALSEMCDTRVIWGGDQTIAMIRQSPLSPRGSEITFADRYSIAVIGAEGYLAAENKKRVAQDFFNDTYLTDQNACTSPRLIVWLGEKEKAARARAEFWAVFRKFVVRRYEIQPVQAVDKLTALCLMGAECDVRVAAESDNVIVRAETASLDEHTMDYRAGSGFFIEYETENMADIMSVCGLRCQTLSYLGVDKEVLSDWIMHYKPRGVDRIVPVGHTMDFSLVWDGVDLVRAMSRKVNAR